MKSYIVKERPDGSRYFDENTPAGNINPDVVGDGLKYTDGKLSVDDAAFVHKSGDESVEGTKTFVSSPVVPTVADSGDATTKAASTAFVQGALAPVKSDVEGIKDQIKDLKVATQDMTFYVRKTGSDDNDGLTEGTAFATITRAVSVSNVYVYINNATHLTIDIGAGTWDENFSQYVNYKAPIITFTGAGATTVLKPTQSIYFTGKNYVEVKNLSVDITNMPANSSALYMSVGGQFTISDITFTGTNSTVNLLQAYAGVQLFVSSGFTVRNCTCSRVFSILASLASITANITISTLTCSIFLYTSGTSYVTADSSTISGTCTGKRYDARTGAIITTGGKGENFFPGTIAGTATTSGQYY